MRRIITWLFLPGAVLCATPVAAQTSFEVAPLIGYQFGGTFRFQPGSQLEAVRISLGDAVSGGVAAGVRFDEYSRVEFHWMRSKPSLRVNESGIRPADLPGGLGLDRFHVDFTREFPIEDQYPVRPFVTVGVGVARVAGSGNSFTRLSFGVGTGVSFQLHSRVGLRIQTHWLPIWIEPKVKALACAGACVFVLGGSFLHQGEVSIGPVFRF